MPYTDPEKRRENDRRYRERNRFKLQERKRLWREKNIDRVRGYSAKTRERYKAQISERKRLKRLALPKGEILRMSLRTSDYYRIQRRTLINELGRYCCCDDTNCFHEGICGFSDVRALQFDHKNGDGKQDYKRFKGVSRALVTYYLLHLDEAREKLQVHCANCNWVKRANNLEFTTVRKEITESELCSSLPLLS